MKFNYWKMLRKAAKVGSTATVGTGGFLGVSGGNPVHGIWAGLVSALLTCAVNYFNEKVIKKNG